LESLFSAQHGLDEARTGEQELSIARLAVSKPSAESVSGFEVTVCRLLQSASFAKLSYVGRGGFIACAGREPAYDRAEIMKQNARMQALPFSLCRLSNIAGRDPGSKINVASHGFCMMPDGRRFSSGNFEKSVSGK
jgi:hypothetical protein